MKSPNPEQLRTQEKSLQKNKILKLDANCTLGRAKASQPVLQPKVRLLKSNKSQFEIYQSHNIFKHSSCTSESLKVVKQDQNNLNLSYIITNEEYPLSGAKDFYKPKYRLKNPERRFNSRQQQSRNHKLEGKFNSDSNKTQKQVLNEIMDAYDRRNSTCINFYKRKASPSQK